MSESPDEGTEALVTGPGRCYRHPMRETGVRCVRCNRPICPDCMRPASVGFMCPDDVKLGNAGIRQPTTVVGAAVPRGELPLVSYTLIGLNVAVFLVTSLGSANGLLHNSAGGLFSSWVLNPRFVAVNHQYYRLLTSAFLHISVLHIGFNMFALYVVGPPLERLLGRWRFGVVYVLSALGGSAAIMAFGSTFGAVAGASGAIFGLFAAAFVLARQLRIDTRSLGITLVINLVLTFTVPNISIEGHIGGFVVGGLAALAIGGLPARSPRRLATSLQSGGLAGIGLVVLVVLAVRIITYPTA